MAAIDATTPFATPKTRDARVAARRRRERRQEEDHRDDSDDDGHHVGPERDKDQKPGVGANDQHVARAASTPLGTDRPVGWKFCVLATAEDAVRADPRAAVEAGRVDVEVPSFVRSGVRRLHRGHTAGQRAVAPSMQTSRIIMAVTTTRAEREHRQRAAGAAGRRGASSGRGCSVVGVGGLPSRRSAARRSGAGGAPPALLCEPPPPCPGLGRVQSSKRRRRRPRG